jgi:hypothetical protein
LAAALALAAQTTAEPPPPATPRERPGLLKAGPFYITPQLRLGTIGMDTNVFYTATDRRTDFTASGGPGLEVLLPMRSSRLLLDGGLSYIYFLRTASQRRLAGGGRGRLEVGGPALLVGAEAGLFRTFERPNFEVDRRVVQDTKTQSADLSLNPAGRFGVRLSATRRDVDVPAGQPFRGADLTRAFSRREQGAVLNLRYRVTVKTSLVAEADYQQDRFDVDETRDANSERLGGGFQVESQTRLSGRVVGGARRMRFPNLDRELTAPYAVAELTYHVGPRTRLGVSYGYDVVYTAFQTVEGTPTLRLQRYGARLEKGLVGRMDIILTGAYSTIRTDGTVRVILDQGQTASVRRDDSAWQGGADLGYRFPWGLRLGLGATYTDRRSTFADLGLEGLLLGATVTYTPH